MPQPRDLKVCVGFCDEEESPSPKFQVYELPVEVVLNETDDPEHKLPVV